MQDRVHSYLLFFLHFPINLIKFNEEFVFPDRMQNLSMMSNAMTNVNLLQISSL